MRYSTEPREQYKVLRFVLRLRGSRCFFLGGRLTEIPFQPSTCGFSLLKDSILWAAQYCFQIPQSDNVSFDFFLTTCNPLPLSQRKRWILNWGVIYRQWNKIHTEVDSSISFQECLCHDPPPHLSKGHLHSWYLSVCCVHCDWSSMHSSSSKWEPLSFVCAGSSGSCGLKLCTLLNLLVSVYKTPGHVSTVSSCSDGYTHSLELSLEQSGHL